MIAALLAEQGFGLDDLMRFGVLFAFLILPMIKKLLLARSGGEPDAAGEPDPAGELDPEDTLAREGGRQATEQWERLLRGEAPEWAPQPDAAGELLVEQPEAAPEPAPRPLRKAFSELPGARSEPLEGSPHSPFVPLSSHAPLVPHATEDPGVFPSANPAGLPSGLSSRLRQPHGRPVPTVRPCPSGSRRPDWRQAVVLSEVLALPLALRKHAPWMGRT